MDDFKTDIDAVAVIGVVPTILDVVCSTTGMGFATVARVTDKRWIACGVRDDIQFGLKPGDELKVETTICHEVRDKRAPIVIDNVSADMVFCNHPTPKLYGFQSYISVPIILADGTFFGTLCAIDPKPARLNRPEIVGMFRLFAELIAFHLEAQEKLASSALSLKEERETAELREQFIAVLGHDLRNPLAAITSGVTLLERSKLEERPRTIVSLIKASASRMSELIENVLDFARGRLGGGITIKFEPEELLGFYLKQVIAELQSSRPEKVIETDFAIGCFVECDQRRVAQLFSNLLGNALTHGLPGKPVKVSARTSDDEFILSIANSAPPIPPTVMDMLFNPFFRGEARPNQQGLGLGLYIASEIARAHGGVLEARSSAEETCFTFRMPLRQGKAGSQTRALEKAD